MLNRGNKIISRCKISAGGVSGTIVDFELLFKKCLENLTSVILIHNHPSGNPNPSQADITLTKKIKEAGKLLEIPVLDHIIVADSTYFSFADEQLL